MLRRLLFASMALALGGAAHAQQDGGAGAAAEGVPPEAARHVENLAGCFAVTYRFAEDGTHDLFNEEYVLDEPLNEWIGMAAEDGAGAVTLVHASITGDGRVVPHFHEIWTHHPDEASWTQEVWSHAPDDERRELRYQCTAPWDLNLWQCHAGEAPKPFRDRGAPFGFDRTDYDLLDRHNTVLVTDQGWVHSQHNRKMTADGALVAHELGWITYRRLPDEQCRVAIEQFAAGAERAS